MKKLFALFALVAFIGVYTIPATASSNNDQVVVVDKDKCPKCGSEKCDGKCTAEAGKTKQSSAKKTGTCDHSVKKSECDHNKATNCATKSDKGKKENGEKEKK